MLIRSADLETPIHLLRPVKLKPRLNGLALAEILCFLRSPILALAGLSAPVPLVCAQGGVPLWTNTYSRPSVGHYATAAAADREGNFFVTGYSGDYGGAQYATIAYSGQGLPLWTNRYNGLATGNNYAWAIALDSDSNVFVTGDSVGLNGFDYDRATVAYSNAGIPLWTNRYRGQAGGEYYYLTATAIAATPCGQVIVTGGSAATNYPYHYDYVTAAYSSAGTPLWTNSYNGPGNWHDFATAVAVAPDATVLVTGFSWSGSAFGYATVAYSSSGTPLWTNRYSRSPSYDSRAVALAVNSNGNVFVTGYSAPSGGGYAYATIAYSSLGTALWTNLYGGSGVGDHYATALSVAGNRLFVTGYSKGSSTGYDYATVAYSSAGAALWTNRYDGPRSTNDYAQAIAADSSGNVFVTGHSVGTDIPYSPYYGYDYATLAYSRAGVPLWTNRYAGPGGRDDYATAITVDGNDNVCVAGYAFIDTPGPSFGYHYATIKHSPSSHPFLASQNIGNNLVLSWTNSAFSLQSAPSPNGLFTNVPLAVSPYTNPPLGAQQFFRLSAP